MSTTKDALQRAIDYLGAVKVRNDAGLTALGESIQPARYAFNGPEFECWAVTSSDYIAEHYRALSAGIDKGEPVTLMPVWWLPEQRIIKRCRDCGIYIDALETGFHSKPCKDDFACHRTELITADLETGAEVPA